MRNIVIGLVFLSVPGFAQAVDCASVSVPQAAPLRPTVLAPISSELATPTYQLGAQGSVLSQAYDESQSVDQVLLRLRIEGCASIANAMPAPSALNPNDPAAYKPKTEFDNTPWRFDMSQNGKRMTADEFGAWMKSRGVRIAKGAAKPPVVDAAPVAPMTPTAATAATPAMQTQTAAPASQPAASATQPTVPATQPAAPATQPTVPATQLTAPATQPVAPAIQTVEPAVPASTPSPTSAPAAQTPASPPVTP